MECRLGAQGGARWPAFEPQLFPVTAPVTSVIALTPLGCGLLVNKCGTAQPASWGVCEN